jgi:hypothetical protein
MLSLKGVTNWCQNTYSIEIRQITTNQHKNINAEIKYAQSQGCYKWARV